VTHAERAAPVSLGCPRFSTRVAGAFLVTDARFPAAHRIPTHYHDRAVVGITLAGEWDSVLGATRLANAPGLLHVEPAGDSHSNHFGGEGAHVVIIQPNAGDSTMQPFASLLASARQTRVGPHGTLLAEDLRRELLRPDDLTTLGIESLAVDLLIAASGPEREETGPAPTWLKHAVEYLDARFRDRPTLSELGQVAGVSPDRFNREFQRCYRIGAVEYLRRRRLDWAAGRLRERGESLGGIAAAAGFTDQRHFTRHFRRRFGMTPSAYRAASRERHER
jgi:AraC-like DNA-binding protein